MLLRIKNNFYKNQEGDGKKFRDFLKYLTPAVVRDERERSQFTKKNTVNAHP